jgi:hypothetical protein
LGGTTNFLSGLHPDLTNYNRMTPPRADDLGFLVRDGSLPPRSLVFLVLAFGPSPIGSLPLQTLIPNATGNVCINFVEGSTLLSLTDGTGVAQFDLQLNSGQRALLAGMSPSDFWYQALVLTQTAAAHATGCGIQHL